MTKKEELIKRLSTLSDSDYLRYLTKANWCVREIVDEAIKDYWSDEDIEEELKFLEERNIGTL
jgi:hypothetical protein|tara:strand:- start:1415 stop:1603 length:189 start_codon:yes stop_codon:yes gene_type:complete